MADTVVDKNSNMGEGSAYMTDKNHCKWKEGWLWEQSVSEVTTDSLKLPAYGDNEKEIDFIWFYLVTYVCMYICIILPTNCVLCHCLYQKGPTPTNILHPRAGLSEKNSNSKGLILGM